MDKCITKEMLAKVTPARLAAEYSLLENETWQFDIIKDGMKYDDLLLLHKKAIAHHKNFAAFIQEIATEIADREREKSKKKGE